MWYGIIKKEFVGNYISNMEMMEMLFHSHEEAEKTASILQSRFMDATFTVVEIRSLKKENDDD